MKLDKKLINLLKSWVKKMHKEEKRKFQAEITNEYLWWSPRKAQTIFWWKATTVKLWQNELRTGITCELLYKNRGQRKTEEINKNLKKDIDELVKNDFCADEKLWNSFKYLKISAREVCEMLEKEKWYKKWWISIRTMNKILNRLWYNRKKIQKNKPLKKNSRSRWNI
jgi:hypothetical protein